MGRRDVLDHLPRYVRDAAPDRDAPNGRLSFHFAGSDSTAAVPRTGELPGAEARSRSPRYEAPEGLDLDRAEHRAMLSCSETTAIQLEPDTVNVHETQHG